jgi:peptidoglycan/LPS O-acetylase OafA/YrhL
LNRFLTGGTDNIMSGSSRIPSLDGLGTVSFKRCYLRCIYRISPPFCLVMALAALHLWAGYLKNAVTWSGETAQQEANSEQSFGSLA